MRSDEPGGPAGGLCNGFAYGPLDGSTDEYARLRIQVSGTANARYYADVLGPADAAVFGSGWIDTPSTPEERVFDLPAGKPFTTVALYTWTKDGQRAQNRFHSVRFEGQGTTFRSRFPTAQGS